MTTNLTLSSEQEQALGRTAIIAILIASAALMVWTGNQLWPGFDEIWHIWYAETDSWKLFLEEIRYDSHPPVSYLLLRLLTSAGSSVWWAWSLTAVTGLLSIPFFFKIAVRLDVPLPIATVGTAAFACSHVFVQISLCVRSYSLTVLALLIAFHGLVRLWQHPEELRRIDIIVLTAAVLLAPWTTYTGALPLLSLAASIGLLGCTRTGVVRELSTRILRFRPWPEALLLVVGGIGLFTWFKWTKRASVHHWAGEYLPQDGESAMQFFVRGTNLDVSHFTPLSLAADSLCGPLFLLPLALIGGFHLFDRRRSGASALPILVVLGTLGLLFVAGLERHHPFGGKLRHQYVLFPFLHLAILTCFTSLPRVLKTRVVTLLSTGVLALVYGIWIVKGHLGAPVDEAGKALTYSVPFRELTDELKPGEGMFLGRFSFVGFYGNARGAGPWRWLGTRLVAKNTHVDVFDGVIAGRPTRILRDHDERVARMSLSDQHLPVMRELLDDQELSAIWFVEEYPGSVVPPSSGPMSAALTRALAQHGLRVSRELRTTHSRAWCLVRG